MSQHINLIAFGTFGNPNGFKQTFFVFSDKNIAKSVKAFDLKTDAITLFPKSKIYSIRKELANGINAIAYSIYTFAKERNSDRGGTFIGSSILYLNKIAEEKITINCLNEFHDNLVDKNVQNDIIVVEHSDNFFAVKPKNFDQLSYQIKEVEDLNFAHLANKNLVVYCKTNPEILHQLFEKSIDLLNVFDTIYFTDSEEVATFVNKKGIFQLVQVDGFEHEIQKLQEARIQKTQTSISEFENEKQKLESDRKKLNEEYTDQIAQNELSHQENHRKIEESKNELNQVNQKYESFSRRIDESINNLRSGKKLDQVRQVHNENKRIFIESVNQQTKPNYINKIYKPNTRTSLKESYESRTHQRDSSNDRGYREKERHTEKNNSGVFKVLTVILLLLWIGTIAFFLFFSTTEDGLIKTQKDNQNLTIEQPKAKTLPAPLKELIPKPNSELTKTDYIFLSKKIAKDMPVKEIVHLIFDANPNDIKSIYSTQFEEYANKIIDLNKDCFEFDNDNFIVIKDTLKHIPCYKSKL